MDAPSRLGQARRRVRIARYAIAAVAAAGFAGLAAAVRVAHPGSNTASASSPPAASTSSSSDDGQAEQGQSFGFGSSSVAPAQSAPSVQSGGS